MAPSFLSFYAAALLLLLAPSVRAQWEQFAFTANHTCPNQGNAFACEPPMVCVYDFSLDKEYCCVPDGGVCWTGPEDCSDLKTDCGSFCCLDGREQCTQRYGQANICWSTTPNPVLNVTSAQLNRTYTSLRSASPTASVLSLNTALMSSLTATSTSTTSMSSSTSSTPSISQTSSSQAVNTTDSSSGLTGGAIAGIVIGAIAVVALFTLGAFLIGRQQRRKGLGGTSDGSSAQTYAYQSTPQMYDGDQKMASHQEVSYYAPAHQHHELPQHSTPRVELGVGDQPYEMPATK